MDARREGGRAGRSRQGWLPSPYSRQIPEEDCPAGPSGEILPSILVVSDDEGGEEGIEGAGEDKGKEEEEKAC